MAQETEWFEGSKVGEAVLLAAGRATKYTTLIIALIVAVLMPGCATAAESGYAPVSRDTYTLRNERGDTIHLTAEPCGALPAWLVLKVAKMHYQGNDYEACWLAHQGHVLIFDSSGDITPLPQAAFQKDERL